MQTPTQLDKEHYSYKASKAVPLPGPDNTTTTDHGAFRTLIKLNPSHPI